jgi:hypothetical protein
LKKRKRKQGAGTWILRDLFQSEAFLSLRGFAPQLLILFFGKRKMSNEIDRKGTRVFKCTNCDSLIMTYKELGEKYGISQPRFTRGLDQLLAKGFIEIRHQGGAYKKDKSIYALSTKYTFWKPGTVFSKRPSDVKRGFQGKKKKEGKK